MKTRKAWSPPIVLAQGSPCQKVWPFCSGVGTIDLIGFGDDGLDSPQSDPVGHGILLRWALDLVLNEINNEAEELIHLKESPFHCPDKWTWDSLSQFSLDSQQSFAAKRLLSSGPSLQLLPPANKRSAQWR